MKRKETLAYITLAFALAQVFLLPLYWHYVFNFFSLIFMGILLLFGFSLPTLLKSTETKGYKSAFLSFVWLLMLAGAYNFYSNRLSKAQLFLKAYYQDLIKPPQWLVNLPDGDYTIDIHQEQDMISVAQITLASRFDTSFHAKELGNYKNVLAHLFKIVKSEGYYCYFFNHRNNNEGILFAPSELLSSSGHDITIKVSGRLSNLHIVQVKDNFYAFKVKNDNIE